MMLSSSGSNRGVIVLFALIGIVCFTRETTAQVEVPSNTVPSHSVSSNSVSSNSVSSDSVPPNIVFILADDLGYGELGCYGQQKIRTPNLDRLASQGMCFMQHYTGAPVCAPARCTLLTGQHLGHAEIRGNRDSGNGRTFPGQWPLTDPIVTIAEVLSDAGYRTGAFGKWGLGPSDSAGSPMKQGFERFFGYNCQRNAHSYYPPFLDSNESEIRINAKPIPGHQRKPDGEVIADDYRATTYAPDVILAEAIKFLDASKSGPFFLYLPFVEPHVSMQPPQAWIDQYPESWDADHGVYRGENGYLPHPRPRAAYAAMISDLDEHVGTILDRLDQHNLTDNTIVIFTSDNGPTHPGRTPNFHVGGAGCTFFESTGGLRGFKGSCYEGGLRVPCIVRWPGKLDRGSRNEMPTYFPDWFPTLASIGSADLPKQQTLDGMDLTELMTAGTVPKRRDPLIWNFSGYGGIVAIRDGKWKAIRTAVNRKKPGRWELYDLSLDPTESQDLADQNPDVVKRLEAHFAATRTAEPDFPMPLYDGVSK